MAPLHRVKQTYAADDKTPVSLFPLVTLWTLPLNNAITVPPAYDDTRGFFAIEGDRIAAYDLLRGEQLWVATVHTSVEPVTGDGLLFVVEPQRLAALRATDGSVAWELPFSETLAVPLVWDNGWLVATTTGGEALAFRAIDGHLIWRRNVGAPAHARPALAADRVYIPTSDSRVLALRVDSGAPIWERRLGGPAGDLLALDDRIYVGSKDKYFYCLNTDDGADEWRWRTGADPIGLPAADQRTVFFVSFDNVLRALNRSSGVQRWKTALPLRPSSGPIKAGETLLVTGVSPTLRGYNVSDGKTAGELASPGELAAAPRLIKRPSDLLPTVIVIMRDIVTGATVLALARSFEPAISPITPLPDPIPVTPLVPAPTNP